MSVEVPPHGLRSMLSLRRLLNTTLLRFIIVGFSNFCVSFTVFWLCLRTPYKFALKTETSQFLAYTVATLWSFYWNRKVTFRSTAGRVLSQMRRFVFLQASLAVVSSFLIGLAVDTLDLPPSPSWLVVMSGITVINYLLCKWWALK